MEPLDTHQLGLGILIYWPHCSLAAIAVGEGWTDLRREHTHLLNNVVHDGLEVFVINFVHLHVGQQYSVP